MGTGDIAVARLEYLNSCNNPWLGEKGLEVARKNKIYWQVGEGGKEHEMPEGAIVTFVSSNGDIRTSWIEIEGGAVRSTVGFIWGRFEF